MNIQLLQLGLSPSEATSALLFIHGRGSSGHDITGLAEAIPTENTAWLAPSAPTGSWYPHRFFVPIEQNEPHLTEGLETVGQLLETLQAAGISPAKTGLIGFSQGACLVLEYVARNPRRYGFVAGLSGGLIGPLETARPQIDLEQTPILLGCADEDAHIPIEYVDHSQRIFENSNSRVTRQRFPGNTHAIFPEEITWIQENLAAITGK